jgi:hypothetical protein
LGANFAMPVAAVWQTSAPGISRKVISTALAGT